MKQCFTIDDLSVIEIGVSSLNDICAIVPEDNVMARLARLEKETSEAKIAVAMDAPRHQKLKELSEGIVEMYRVDPGLTGPLMEMVQMMLGAI